DTGQRDCFVAPLLVLFALQVLRADERTSSSRWGWTGLTLGAMLLVRPLIAIAGVPALWVLLTNKEHRSLRNAAFLISWSFAFPLAIVMLYLASGHLYQLYEATIQFNLQVYSKYRHGVSYRGSGVMTYFYIAGIALLV